MHQGWELSSHVSCQLLHDPRLVCLMNYEGTKKEMEVSQNALPPPGCERDPCPSSRSHVRPRLLAPKEESCECQRIIAKMHLGLFKFSYDLSARSSEIQRIIALIRWITSLLVLRTRLCPGSICSRHWLPVALSDRNTELPFRCIRRWLPTRRGDQFRNYLSLQRNTSAIVRQGAEKVLHQQQSRCRPTAF